VSNCFEDKISLRIFRKHIEVTFGDEKAIQGNLAT